MSITELAKSLGFRICARDDYRVFVSPDLEWVISMRGRWAAFGPTDGKPWQEQDFASAHDAEVFVRTQMMSLGIAAERY